MQRLWCERFQDKKNEYGSRLWDEGETLELGGKRKPDGIPKDLIPLDGDLGS